MHSVEFRTFKYCKYFRKYLLKCIWHLFLGHVQMLCIPYQPFSLINFCAVFFLGIQPQGVLRGKAQKDIFKSLLHAPVLFRCEPLSNSTEIQYFKVLMLIILMIFQYQLKSVAKYSLTLGWWQVPKSGSRPYHVTCVYFQLSTVIYVLNNKNCNWLIIKANTTKMQTKHNQWLCQKKKKKRDLSKELILQSWTYAFLQLF